MSDLNRQTKGSFWSVRANVSLKQAFTVNSEYKPRLEQAFFLAIPCFMQSLDCGISFVNIGDACLLIRRPKALNTVVEPQPRARTARRASDGRLRVKSVGVRCASTFDENTMCGIWRGTEAVITARTRNPLGALCPTWVRIPPSPPKSIS